MVAVRDRLEEFDDKTDVYIVTFTDPANIDGYESRNALAFPVLFDPDRVGYRAFGLGRGTFARIWGWRAAKRYIEIFRTNGFGDLRPATDDTRQLGGDFVVDPAGTLAYAFWGAGPDDRPSVDQLIDAVRTINSPK